MKSDLLKTIERNESIRIVVKLLLLLPISFTAIFFLIGLDLIISQILTN